MPSFLERLWTERPAAGRICGIASSDESIRAAHEWLDYAASARSATTRAGAPSVLSRRECADGRVETIEPLVGVARHPFASVGCHLPGRGGLAANVTEKSIYDITYLVLANNCGENRQMNVSSGRRLFSDLGCTTYGNGSNTDDTHGGARSPSLPLFDRLYERQCLPLTQHHDPEVWWRNVPAHARARLSFFNVPIEED